MLNVYPDYTQTALFEHEKRSGGARRPYRGYVSSAAVAKAIARAIIKDRREVILSPRGKVLSILQGVWPSFVEKKMRFIADRLRERKEYSHA